MRVAELGRRAKVNDLWIAAVAAANRMDVVTQDDDSTSSNKPVDRW